MSLHKYIETTQNSICMKSKKIFRDIFWCKITQSYKTDLPDAILNGNVRFGCTLFWSKKKIRHELNLYVIYHFDSVTAPGNLLLRFQIIFHVKERFYISPKSFQVLAITLKIKFFLNTRNPLFISDFCFLKLIFSIFCEKFTMDHCV